MQSQNERVMERRNYPITEKERDLIDALRNYRKSYPNGYPDLLFAAQEIFDELAEPIGNPED